MVYLGQYGYRALCRDNIRAAPPLVPQAEKKCLHLAANSRADSTSGLFRHHQPIRFKCPGIRPPFLQASAGMPIQIHLPNPSAHQERGGSSTRGPSRRNHFAVNYLLLSFAPNKWNLHCMYQG
jgi:hypothetical protein